MSDQHIHGDLGDQTPGYDPDFDYPHLDAPEIGEASYPCIDPNAKHSDTIHVMTEEEAMRMPIMLDGEAVDTY